ncbi:MAG TPA: phosphoribosylglycinamide formyltransferase [Acidimicrobiia bacterium]|jgi:phosphoribosylglycinamide formyltransferase-1
MTAPRKPIAVLVSGSGTNLQALLDWSHDPTSAFRVAVVVSDRPKVGALGRASAAGVPAVVVDWRDQPNREAFTKAVCDVVDEHGASALVLAGFMRVLAPEAMARFPAAVINIHPSLLPSFPGADAVGDALAHGVKVTGVTVHFAEEQVDHGPIIAQEAVPVLEDDTRATLQARIQHVEHRVYPQVVQAFAADRLAIEGRSVVWETA